jgi:hypothetical protein
VLLTRLAEGHTASTAAVPQGGADIEARVRALNRAARFSPGQPSCLPRALALWWLLRRSGIAAELRIGARRAAGRLEAHAWVEHAGQVLGDQADVHVRFAAFASQVRPQVATRSMPPTPPAGSTRPLEASSR